MNTPYRCKMAFRKGPVFTSVRRPFIRNGYKIEIFNNNYWSFPFEWKITAPTSRPRHIPRVFHDPTSHRSIKMAIVHAKEAATSPRSPYWRFNINE